MARDLEWNGDAEAQSNLCVFISRNWENPLQIRVWILRISSKIRTNYLFKSSHGSITYFCVTFWSFLVVMTDFMLVGW